MSCPKKLTIGPFRYAVMVPSFLPDADGATNYSQRVIAVNGSLSEQSQRETLLHEVLHAVIDQTGFRNLEKEEEEKLVASLSPPLLSVLRSNPTFVSFLTE